MRRFLLLIQNEFKLSRTSLVVNLIAILQPTLMYILMATIMVVPTFEMRIVKPNTNLERELVSAMGTIGSPIGPDYIQPVLVENKDLEHSQVIEVVEVNGRPTALQRFSYIDSNLVKNLRNRLTAALLVLWNGELGDQALTVREHPWLPHDIPYNVYFGMAMIPLAAYLAAAMIGGYMMAQDFEGGTILIYRLSPTPGWLILAAKLTRLLLTGLAAGAILYTTVGILTGVWASSLIPLVTTLIPLSLTAACLGLIAGLITRSSLPSFLISLASAFTFWLIGSGFGLAAGFSSLFETISRLIPNTAVIELIFPYFYFGRQVASHPNLARLQLAGYTLVLLFLVGLIYHKRVTTPKR